MTATDGPLAPWLASLERRAVRIGGVVLGGAVAVAWLAPSRFFQSYLLAYLFWLGVALGSLAVLMVHALTGGGWGLVIRRLLQANVRTLPWLALLFVPVAVGLPWLYDWAGPGALDGHSAKGGYLTRPFFVLRAVAYFAVWIGLARWLDRYLLDLDRGVPGRSSHVQLLSGVGLVLYGLTATFAAVDWLMSLEPQWHSTVFGLIVIVGHTLTALAFTIPVLLWLARWPPLDGIVLRDHRHDLGNLLLAFVLIWAYLGYSQYLIIWSGNLPGEVSWYLTRTQGGWQAVGLSLVVFHFVVPFALLLLRVTKRTARALAGVALFLLVLRWVDLWWLVRPPFAQRVQLHWLDGPVMVGVGALWLAVMIRALRARPLGPAPEATTRPMTMPAGATPEEAS